VKGKLLRVAEFERVAGMVYLRRIGLIFLIVLSPGISARAGDQKQSVKGTLTFQGIERSYLLHVPASYSGKNPVPLVIFFHGGGGTGASSEKFAGFSSLSDREGFLVAYPDGVGKSWNDGRAGEKIKAQSENIDDIGFISALLDKLLADYRIDPARVYATGPSNGGIFSHRVGAELSERIAAIAPVIGGMAPGVAKKFNPRKPVPVLMINGTDDPLVPFGGGEIRLFGRGGRGEIIPTDKAVKKWVAHNGCRAEPVVGDMPDTDPGDGTRVRKAVHSGGRQNSEVILYTVEGGGHTWSGGNQYLPKAMIGRLSRDMDATKIIWDFFSKHRREGIPPEK
jgi:polyhydroxybutyrate depolymerase